MKTIILSFYAMCNIGKNSKDKRKVKKSTLLCSRSIKSACRNCRLEKTYKFIRNIDSTMHVLYSVLCSFFSSHSLSFISISEGHEPRKRNHDHRQSRIIIILKKVLCTCLKLSEIKTIYWRLKQTQCQCICGVDMLRLNGMEEQKWV